MTISNAQKYGKHSAVKIADSNVGGGAGFDTYPLYSLGFLQEKRKSAVIDMVDVTKLKVPGVE